MTITTTNHKLPHWKNVPISKILSTLGHKPIAQNGNLTIYRSIFSSSINDDTHLHVNENLNVWFDKKLKRGGNLEDFLRYFWPNLAEQEIENKLSKIRIQTPLMIEHCVSNKPRRKRKSIKLPVYEISQIKNLGNNAKMTALLDSTGLWDVTELKIQEINYFLLDQKGVRKEFTGLGWQNENGGWEVRAHNFQAVIGPKGITAIRRSNHTLAIFLSLEDYQRYRQELYKQYASILIAGSEHFLPEVFQRTKQYKCVRSYIGK